MPKAATATPIRPARKTAVPITREMRKLAPIQQLIADEVADMLVHGSESSLITSLTSAAVHHKWLRYTRKTHAPSQTEERNEFVNKLGARDLPQWKTDLEIALRANQQAPPAKQVEPTTVTARIRARVIDDLRDRFEAFLAEGTPEEHNLMLDILQDRDGNGWRDDPSELALGRCFEYALDNCGRDYVKVPVQMREQVDRYLSCLAAANARDPK